MKYDLCCIGPITQDKIITSIDTHYLPGGTAFYFSHAAGNLAPNFLLVTKLAEQDSHLLDSLKQRSLQIKVCPSQHTLFFENCYGQDSNDRTQKVKRVADAFLYSEVERIEAQVFHLGPLLATDVSDEMIKALAAKSLVSLDVQGLLRKVIAEDVVAIDWPTKHTVLPFIHFLKASEEEMHVLTGCTNVYEGARRLAEWGVKEVIITAGNKGSLIYDGSEFFLIPAYVPSQLKDATGCGDTYMAGYLSQRLAGSSISRAGRIAAAVATLKLAIAGPFSGTLSEAEAVIETGYESALSIRQTECKEG